MKPRATCSSKFVVLSFVSWDWRIPRRPRRNLLASQSNFVSSLGCGENEKEQNPTGQLIVINCGRNHLDHPSPGGLDGRHDFNTPVQVWNDDQWTAGACTRPRS
ncbi:hypothetical protein ElyMa_002349700 [Elysia marginata]|uniref:Uncharacterized protein n=1 Tax=Elysia marginata TaxID=1093978 RepID=A0AAV4G7Z6_9GAST|nr:hypothetical protein ElyMa_002349700 [Elysia marginata]